MTLERLKKGFKNLDNYRWSIVFTLPISLIFLIYLGIQSDFLLAQWALDCILISSFVGRFVSGGSYFARLLDASTTRQLKGKEYVLLTPANSKLKISHPIGRYERWGTRLGVALGIAVGIAACFLHAAVPLVGPLSVVAFPVYVLGFTGIFGGLGQRFGIGLDRNRNREFTEKTLMISFALLGIALGFALFFTSGAAVLAVSGVTPFVVGAAFPLVLEALVFALVSGSIFASAADYLGKSLCYLYSFRTQKGVEFSEIMAAKRHEYRGALVGVILGAGISAALMLSLPILPVGVVGAAVASIVALTLVGVLGGLSSRVGRLMDGFNEQKAIEAASASDENPKGLNPSPANTPVNLSVSPSANRARASSAPALFKPAANEDKNEEQALLTRSVSVASFRG